MAAQSTLSSPHRFRVAMALVVAFATVVASQASAGSVALRGTLSVVQEDDFEHDRTARRHSLVVDATGARFELRFSRLPASRLRTGDRVVVRGRAEGRVLHEDALEALAAADPPALETRRAVVLVADFSDSVVSCS